MKWLHQLNDKEISVCILFNRINQAHIIISQFFSIISRLGNGVFWYFIMIILPIIHGKTGGLVSLHMIIVGTVGVAIYKWLKTSNHRVRPIHYNGHILQNVPALDQFSFPSGHTLHAVAFTLILIHYYPTWAILLVPFTILTAISRIILGLHYPSDVFAGFLLGVSLAEISINLLSRL